VTVTLITTSLYRATINGEIVEDLSDLVVSGSVTLDVTREVKLSMEVTLREPWRVRPYVDYLLPRIRYDYDDGRAPVESPLGIYAVRTPPGQYTDRIATATFSGEDLTSVLATSAYQALDTVPSGTNVVTELTQTLGEAGITRVSFPQSSRTFRKAWTFPAGTTRLEKCNKVLSHIAWYEMAMTLDGIVGSAGPFKPLYLLQPSATWTEDDLLEAPVEQPSDTLLANVVIVVKDDPTEAPIIGVAKNTDPASPTSTVAIGREIVRVVSSGDIHSQADADDLAKRLLAESRLRYRTAEFVVDPNPKLLNPWQQVVKVAFSSGPITRFNGLWRVNRATVGLDPAEPALQVVVAQVATEKGVPV